MLCFIVRCFLSILVLQSSWWGCNHLGCFAWFVFLVSRGGWVAFPRSAMGLSVVFPDHTHLLFFLLQPGIQTVV